MQIVRVSCPKLNASIAFNRIGFRHLIRKGGVRRPRGEQKRRFALLRYAPGIISNPRANVVLRTKGRAHFWMFQEERGGRMVKVIVRQLRGGKKHFYSIFSGKKKPSSN